MVTLYLTLVAGFCGLTAGTVLAALSQSPLPLVRWLVVAYVEVFRNTPILIQLIWIHFALPVFTGWNTTALQSGTIAIALQASAYFSEIVRGGIESIPKGQWEAAYALGLPAKTTWTRVILPPALRRMQAQHPNLTMMKTEMSALGVSDFITRTEGAFDVFNGQAGVGMDRQRRRRAQCIVQSGDQRSAILVRKTERTGSIQTHLHPNDLARLERRSDRAMKSFFSIEELRGAVQVRPFDFTKGAPVLRVPLVAGSSSFAAHGPGAVVDTQTVLFDLRDDPGQHAPYRDAATEARLSEAIASEMERHDAPKEAFRRFALTPASCLGGAG